MEKLGVARRERNQYRHGDTIVSPQAPLGINIRNATATSPLVVEVWYDADREIDFVFELKDEEKKSS